ncbi:hypothetical protein HPP92_021156 [Vanilla planifolia]|uniref:Uncharacterized protein n=1 Tax=Vanilla planifolia TaxID=51239 RepID=A0A835Q0I5_VANPL|nr:hypothetical protein HPP92_021156 [Vanilla planifolia]
MDTYRLNPSSNGISNQRANFLSSATSQFSLPPKPHLIDPPIFPFLRPEPPKLAEDRVVRRTEESEISIFDAERYFNEGHNSRENTSNITATVTDVAEKCHLSPTTGDSSVSSFDGFTRTFRSRSFQATPTASSEASWNSQTGLLRNPPGSLSVNLRSFPNGEQRKDTSSANGRRLIGHHCSCFGKKSVQVEERCPEPKPQVIPSCSPNQSSATKMASFKADMNQIKKVKVLPGIRAQDPEIFRVPGRYSFQNSFPSQDIDRWNFSSGGLSFPVVPHRKEAAAEEPARVSLEVFRPINDTAPPLRKTDLGDRRSFIFPGSPKTRQVSDEDVASDASSDLFEIESLSTQAGFRRRDSLDELSETRKAAVFPGGFSKFRQVLEDEEVTTPSIAPSECYPPSEVSVEWSIATAEGFDRVSVANFSSAVSDCDELHYAAEGLFGGKKKAVGGGGGGILSCRSEKAVNVVGPKLVRFDPVMSERVEASISVPGVALERVVGMSRLGAAKPVHDGSGVLGLHGRVRFA